MDKIVLWMDSIMDAIRAYLTYGVLIPRTGYLKNEFTNGRRVTYVFKAYGDGRVMQRHSTFHFSSSHSGSGMGDVPIVDAATIYGAVLCILCCAVRSCTRARLHRVGSPSKLLTSLTGRSMV
jgi:hypothetical protein